MKNNIKDNIKIGIVVHGPTIIDSGYAMKIIDILSSFGEVEAILGGNIGKTAVIDASLENIIDISTRRLPSESVKIFKEKSKDYIFLINYGNSQITGQTFGFKVFKNSFINNGWKYPKFIQIERPGEDNGSLISWNIFDFEYNDNSLDISTKNIINKIINEIAILFSLDIVDPHDILNKYFDNNDLALFEDYIEFIKSNNENNEYNYINIQNDLDFEDKIVRDIRGVNPNENIFVNGLVIGKSTSCKLKLIATNGYITEIVGGVLNTNASQKLGKVDLNKVIVKTGLLRKLKVTPRILEDSDIMSNNNNNNNCFKVAFVDNGFYDIYNLNSVDLAIAIGDDTTLIASDILYRFNIPIIGIINGNIDNVVLEGFQTKGSIIIELGDDLDNIIGTLIFKELFSSKNIIKYEKNSYSNNFSSKHLFIEDFSKKILKIVKNITSNYKLNYY
ncbi:DUF2117 domain-containing protein [Methanobrevibacter filiformis]|uniref:DUF2117 domain-containing protein n=1 Tax=Methanobrevibacter filiformis TaxID=55758 RepID=A0A162FA14_9EURY|nr:DUF2117 domain-containing protein [Methanobrevibacter filiformis]KZX10085.1 hypothetical protein MBFIL_18960 [Methanobrevibacter filiformis]